MITDGGGSWADLLGWPTVAWLAPLTVSPSSRGIVTAILSVTFW